MSEKSAESLDSLFSKIGELTPVQRYSIYGGSMVVLVAAFVYFIYLPKHEQIAKLKKQHQSLESQLVTATEAADKLPAQKKAWAAAKIQFVEVKKTLPEKKDIPSLLEGISDAGRDAGLIFQSFQPKNEVRKNFYAEIPVSLKISGNYHNIAVFFDKIARLSRIVNIKDIKLNKSGKGLKTSCTAVTYRFVDGPPKKKKKKKKRRK